MRPLLYKTTKPVLIYTLVVFIISIPVYFFVVDTIWQSELDEHNQILADRTAYQLNKLHLSKEALEKSMLLWNAIQPGTTIAFPTADDDLQDRVYIIDKQKNYATTVNIDRFRCLSTIIHIQGIPLRFTVETNIEESEETVAAIAITTLFFFLLIVAGILLINRRYSIKIWQPFRDSLEKLKLFNLHQQAKVDFTRSDVTEFEELHSSLRKLIDHTVLVYSAQKEFTENASHELQTPLAILKSKVDLLLQSEQLTAAQYELIEEINKALTRSARINKNLLLLAKIENSQFDQSNVFFFDKLVKQSMRNLREHFDQKQQVIDLQLSEPVQLRGNENLTEILINNLLLNAMRHTAIGGSIVCLLDQSGFQVSNSGDKALPTTLLFRRFSRLSSNNAGSGLGLAIVQEIAKSQHWTVTYHFEDNRHYFTIQF